MRAEKEQRVLGASTGESRGAPGASKEADISTTGRRDVCKAGQYFSPVTRARNERGARAFLGILRSRQVAFLLNPRLAAGEHPADTLKS